MKKIDLHIHTVQTEKDSAFDFSLAKLGEYVQSSRMDVIAITNHNCFDLSQFKEITDAVPIDVFPGVEIDLEGGHILLISDKDSLVDFAGRCRTVTDRTKARQGSLSVNDLNEIFADLSRYLLIPHYDKKPVISSDTLSKLRGLITAGEVTSPKKFCYCINEKEALVPVYFSDIRISTGLSSFPARQTYVDVSTVTLSALKMCLGDRNKVFLALEDGHRVFDALQNGMRLSTGLNVVLGERSSGKTYTLDRISESNEKVKYIRQFSLQARDEDSETKRFNSVLSQNQSLFTQEYLRELKEAVDSMAAVDLARNERALEQFLVSLLKNAKESERADLFAKAQLFSETEFPIRSLDGLKDLVSAVESLINNIEYRSVIDKYMSAESLMELVLELMNKYAEESEINLKKIWLNDLIGTIRKELQVRTAATVVKDVDFYNIAIQRMMAGRFKEVVDTARTVRQIPIKDVQGFKIVAKTRSFEGAQELKNLSGKKVAFSDAFQQFGDPYAYLMALRNIEGIEASEYYRYFVNVEYRILNKYGFDVSGGERSEFNLLQEIGDAQQYDMLLIDEPESSFDNLFLRNEVNELIRDVSKSVPTVVVTHNNTVGASIRPDYVVFTQKRVTGGQVEYEVYSGHATDKYLEGSMGRKIKNFDIILNCLEAGETAYVERRDSYETLED